MNRSLDGLTEFYFEGELLPIEFLKTDTEIAPGVEAHDYRIKGDTSRDLAIIPIQPGCKTPLQLVKEGTRTVEGFVEGSGTLIVWKPNGEKRVFTVADVFQEDVQVGDVMQWIAGPGGLVFFEICYPPYEDDRYENLELTYSLTTDVQSFDGCRRRGENQITILIPDEKDVPLSLHVKSDGLLALLEVYVGLDPWGDGKSTVQNMRSFKGPLNTLLEKLGKIDEPIQIR